MRQITFLILLIGSFSVVRCQTFKGTVYDQSSDSTLSFAAVYISGTSSGTFTDSHGNFTLDISNYPTMPISVSLIGYKSIIIAEHSNNKKYNIFLSPKINELNEVVVKANGNGPREKYLSLFKREFLGETGNASECNILNEDDLRFSYNPDSSSLRAFSSKPILIHNKALGYTITYYLDKFNSINKSDEKMHLLTRKFDLLGTYLFKDNSLTLSIPEKRKVEARRKKTYLGSRMHFFRTLYLGNLVQVGKYNIFLMDKTPDSKGFSIDSKISVIYSDSIVIGKDSISGCFKNKGKLYIKFQMKKSILDVKNNSVYFQKNGYFDPIEILFSGDMAKQRIGDLLPFEYKLD
jgi:hypothetical protein